MNLDVIPRIQKVQYFPKRKKEKDTSGYYFTDHLVDIVFM